MYNLGLDEYFYVLSASCVAEKKSNMSIIYGSIDYLDNLD